MFFREEKHEVSGRIAGPNPINQSTTASQHIIQHCLTNRSINQSLENSQERIRDIDTTPERKFLDSYWSKIPRFNRCQKKQKSNSRTISPTYLIRITFPQEVTSPWHTLVWMVLSVFTEGKIPTPCPNWIEGPIPEQSSTVSKSPAINQRISVGRLPRFKIRCMHSSWLSQSIRAANENSPTSKILRVSFENGNVSYCEAEQVQRGSRFGVVSTSKSSKGRW